MRGPGESGEGIDGRTWWPSKGRRRALRLAEDEVLDGAYRDARGKQGPLRISPAIAAVSRISR